MPFELRALEAALYAGTSVLEMAVGHLESQAFPALDKLILHVSHPGKGTSLESKALLVQTAYHLGRIMDLRA